MGVKVSIKAKRNNTRRICNNIFIFAIEFALKSASNLNDNLNCSKELEHYAS